MDRNTGHGLIESTVYGPVLSRRYGKTIGINPLPTGEKFCNFSCVYCQLGMKRVALNKASFPSVEQIHNDLELFLARQGKEEKCDDLVISGNGEPTLHPEFPELVETLLKLRDKEAPWIKILCFTNGSTLARLEIRQALLRLDECALKLDPALEFVDLPDEAFKLEDLIKAAQNMPHLVVQSCLFAGRIANISRDDLKDWIKNLILIRPRRVDLYTIARDTAVPGLEPLPAQQLKNIATRLTHDFGLSVKVVS